MKGKVVCSSECKGLQTERSLYSHQGMDGKNASDLIDKQNSFLREPKPGHLEHGNAVDEVPSSSSKQTKETHEKVNSETMNSSINDAESANDVNSAKVAAMKAAELVNKNLVGFGGVGYLSTDQKKKLLWGNKKNSASEESSSCWDFHLFPNQECQENFNRLMDAKGNAAPVDRLDKHVNLQVRKRRCSTPICKSDIPLGFSEEMVELGL